MHYAVFTKPWPHMPLPDLAQLVRELGFDSIELPVRHGFQVTPDLAVDGIPRAQDRLGREGVVITSVAAPLELTVFQGCSQANVPVIRTMVDIDRGHYHQSEDEAVARLKAKLDWCHRYNVKIGLQPHYGDMISSGVAAQRLVDKVADPSVGVVWDAAHDALAGQEPETSLDAVWANLLIINLKNAFYYRSNGPEAGEAQWARYFTTGPHGLASWSRVVRFLIDRGYRRGICLTAEYTDETNTEALTRSDLAYLRSLVAQMEPAGTDQ